MKRLLVAISAVMTAAATFAGVTTYTWTGNAKDGKWCTAKNWNVGSAEATTYPHISSGDNVDVAVFSTAGELTVDVDGDSDIYIKRVDVTKGTLTLTASGKARLCTNQAHNAPGGSAGYTGLNIAQGAKLIVNVPVYTVGQRFDTLGKGIIEWQNTYDKAGGSVYFHAVTNLFTSGSVINNSAAIFMGSDGIPFYAELTGTAKWDYSGSIQISAGSTGTYKGTVVQNGDDTEVSTDNNLLINNSGTTHAQTYILKKGTLDVAGFLTAGNAAGGGTYIQEGGTATFGQILMRFGNVYFKGGTATVKTEISPYAVAMTNGVEIVVSGGTLNLSGAISHPLTVTGGTVNLSNVAVKAPIYWKGGKVIEGEGVTFSGDGKIVMDNTTYKIDGDCTWSALKAVTSGMSGVEVVGDINYTADSAVTVSFEEGDALPAKFLGDTNVSVAIAEGATINEGIYLKVATCNLATGKTLDGKVDLTLLAGTYTYGNIVAMESKSIEIDGTASLSFADDDTVAMSVKLTGGTVAFNGKTAYGDNGKFLFNGGALKFPNGNVYTLSNFLKAVPHEGTKLNFITDGEKDVLFNINADMVLPEALELGAYIVVGVAANVQLTAADDTPPVLTIHSGGKFNLANQSSYIAAPIDLTIDAGGQLLVDAGSGGYARTMIVAHSCTIKGVKTEVGKWVVSTPLATATEFSSSRGTPSYIFVPYTWTGAGDGESIDDLNNWENKQFCEWSSDGCYDFSRATKPIKIGTIDSRKNYNYVMSALAYLPPKSRDGSTVKIVNGEGADAMFSLKDHGGFRTAALCRKGCTVEFGVKYASYGTSAVVGYSGRGTFRFLSSVAAKDDNYFCMDGTVEIGGSLTTDNTGNLSYTENHNSTSLFKFIDGANVVLAGNISADFGDGFTGGAGFLQEGGNVQAAALYMTQCRRADGAERATYTMDGGTLTLDNAICLGTSYPAWPEEKSCGYGTFKMTGGTLYTPIVSNECWRTYCQLLGGDVYMGAGGFVKSTTSSGYKYEAQDYPHFELGAATLHASTDSWSVDSGMDTKFSDTPTFDAAEGKTITLNGAISGTGGFVKTGAGALAITGKYTATGDITVSAGTLSISTPVTNTIHTMTIASLDNVTFGEGVEFNVTRLCIGGEYKAKGTYNVGSGTVVVSGSAQWIGESGGNWSATANWLGGNLPANNDEVYFKMPASGPLSITVDVNTATLGSMRVNAGSVTIAGTQGKYLKFVSAGSVTVAENAQLAFGATVYLNRSLTKNGAGKVTFDGLLRSNTEPKNLTWSYLGTNEVKVVEGEVEIKGEVAGLRLYPCSLDSAIVPKLTISEGAVITNRCYVHGPWSRPSNDGYGDVVVNGGTIDLRTGKDVFGSNGSSIAIANGKYGFAFFKGGRANFTINGGSFVTTTGYTCMNLNNTNGGGGDVTVTVNGGTLKFPHLCYMGVQNNAVDTLVVNGGKLDFTTLRGGSGTGTKIIRFNGGEVHARQQPDAEKAHPRDVLSGIDECYRVQDPTTEEWKQRGSYFEPIEIGGDVVFTQESADIDCEFYPQIKFKYDNPVFKNFGPGKVTLHAMPEGDNVAVTVKNGAKVGLDFEGTKDVLSITRGTRQLPAGDYGEDHYMPATFPGGGILRATTGGAPFSGMVLIVK